MLLVGVAIALSIYIGVLGLGLPAALGLAWRVGLLPLYIVAGIALYPAFRASGRLGQMAALVLTLVFFALPLTAMWSSGTIERPAFVGGLLPWKDASGYYRDARLLLEGNTFTSFASRRPLFSALLATLLGLTQQNLEVTLAILVVITAFACYLLAREMQATHGTPAGVLVLLILFLYYRIYIGSALSENLGLALGALAWAVLWRGAHQRSIALVSFGLFLLTWALNARAGTFFVLPALLIWGVWGFRAEGRVSVKFLVAGSAGVALGFLTNLFLVRVLGSPDGMAFSNFSYTLYGLVVGGKGWAQSLHDHPELASLSEAETAVTLYRLTWAAFLASPFNLVVGMVRYWSEYFHPLSGLFGFVFANAVPGGPWGERGTALILIVDRGLSLATRLGLYVACGAGFVGCWQRRREPPYTMVGVATLGIFVSIPFVPLSDGGHRVYAATMPILITLAVIGIGYIVARLPLRWRSFFEMEEQGKVPFAPALFVFSGILILLVFGGGLVVRWASHAPTFAAGSCPNGVEAVHVRLSQGSAIVLVENGDSHLRHAITTDDFRSGWRAIYDAPIADYFANVHEDSMLMNALDLDSKQQIWLVMPKTLYDQASGIAGFCGSVERVPTEIDGTFVFFRAVSIARWN